LSSNNSRSFRTTDRDDTPIAEAKNNTFVNNSKTLLNSPIEKLKSSIATSSLLVDALSLSDDPNKTFDNLLQSMSRRNRDSKTNNSGSRRKSSIIDRTQDSDSDDPITVDSDRYQENNDDIPRSNQHQLRSPRKNASTSFDMNPVTPHTEPSYMTTIQSTRPSDSKHHSHYIDNNNNNNSSSKKNHRSVGTKESLTYDHEMVNLRSQIEELSRRVTLQSNQLEQYRHELQHISNNNNGATGQ